MPRSLIQIKVKLNFSHLESNLRAVFLIYFHKLAPLKSAATQVVVQQNRAPFFQSCLVMYIGPALPVRATLSRASLTLGLPGTVGRADVCRKIVISDVRKCVHIAYTGEISYHTLLYDCMMCHLSIAVVIYLSYILRLHIICSYTVYRFCFISYLYTHFHIVETH